MASKKNVVITVSAPKPDSPSNLLGRAELTFETGLLAGLRLTGFALWRATTRDGRPFVSVTFPTQPAERGSSTVYYDYLRGTSEDVKRLKGAIVRAYRETARSLPQDFADDIPADETAGAAEAAAY